MLKITGVKLEKNSDMAKRYAQANNKSMKKYDPTKPAINISCLDMNNLYGWAMSGYLP